jgi:hypothetical protein
MLNLIVTNRDASYSSLHITSKHTTTHLRATESVEALVRVSDKRQARSILIVAGLRRLRPIRRTRIVLINLVNREVLRVDVRLQLGFKRRANPA